jgi:hypothetical protein
MRRRGDEYLVDLKGVKPFTQILQGSVALTEHAGPDGYGDGGSCAHHRNPARVSRPFGTCAPKFGGMPGNRTLLNILDANEATTPCSPASQVLVRPAGIEPASRDFQSRTNPSQLQTQIDMEPTEGVEPPTRYLRGSCSATELRGRKWWGTGTRTRDRRVCCSRLLYHLRYAPSLAGEVGIGPTYAGPNPAALPLSYSPKRYWWE